MIYKRGKIFLPFSTFLIIGIFLLYYVVVHQINIYSLPAGYCKDSTFDLSDFDFKNNHIVGLAGEADFYWNQLLSPDDFDSTEINPDCRIKIPGTWNGVQIDGKKLGGFGCATYRFIIHVKEPGAYGLKIKEFDCAYKLWVNGIDSIMVGKVASNKKDMIPSWKREEIYFNTSGNIEVVIQISNFQHRKGGAEDIIAFGKAHDLIWFKQVQSGMSLFLFGVLFILSVYHFVLYYFKRKDKSTILFSLLCFFMMLRLLSTGEKLLVNVFPNINWFVAIRIEYLSYKIAAVIMLGFIRQFFLEEFSLKVVRVSYYIALFFSLIVLFTPVVVFSYTPVFYQVVVMVIAFYILVNLIRASIRKRDNSAMFLGTYFIFLLIIINDILYFNKIIGTGFLMHFGVFVLAFTQAIVLSKRISLAFVKVENLSNELEDYSKSLEVKVEERTLQINEQKSELENQSLILKTANKKLIELGQFKERLTEMIVHDLKNPLSLIINFSENEMVKFASQQMLNMVYNILDTQKYEHSTMVVDKKQLELLAIIEEAVGQIGFLMTDRNILFQCEVKKGYRILGDNQILNRVFINLLSNAIKFTSPNQTIRMWEEIVENKVKIYVSDCGPGIPEDKWHLVFERFGQVMLRKSGAAVSTGLGLTFCKLAVEAHGGQIGFDSVVGKGTTFWFTLELSDRESNHLASMPLKMELDTRHDVVLSADELRMLRAWKGKFDELEVFEISEIKKRLMEIRAFDNENIQNWANRMEEAMWSANVTLFKELVEQLKK